MMIAQKTASMKRKGGMSHSGNRERELVASEKADFMRSMVGGDGDGGGDGGGGGGGVDLESEPRDRWPWLPSRPDRRKSGIRLATFSVCMYVCTRRRLIYWLLQGKEEGPGLSCLAQERIEMRFEGQKE